MRITESRLRSIIRSVIRESMEELPSGNLFDKILQMKPDIEDDLISDLRDIENLSERLSESFFSDPDTKLLGKYFGIAMLILCNLIGAAQGGSNAIGINNLEGPIKAATASGDTEQLNKLLDKLKREVERSDMTDNLGTGGQAVINLVLQTAGMGGEKLATELGTSKYMKGIIKKNNL